MDDAAAAPANDWSSRGGMLSKVRVLSTASGGEMSLATTGVHSLTMTDAWKSAILCIFSLELSSKLKDEFQSSTVYVQ